MKRMYARFVLWLIRPAVDAAIADSVRPGGRLWRFENHGGKALRSRCIVSHVKGVGEVGVDAGFLVNEIGQPVTIPSEGTTGGSR